MTTTTARNLLQDVEATAPQHPLPQRAVPERRHHRREGQEGTGPTSPLQSANDPSDDDGNLIPINALPDHAASTIVQAEAEIRDKIVKDDEGNPTVESVTVKKIKRADKMAGLTLLKKWYFKIVGAEDDGVNALLLRRWPIGSTPPSAGVTESDLP